MPDQISPPLRDALDKICGNDTRTRRAIELLFTNVNELSALALSSSSSFSALSAGFAVSESIMASTPEEFVSEGMAMPPDLTIPIADLDSRITKVEQDILELKTLIYSIYGLSP